VLADGSTVGFRVKKMGLYHVKGRFRELEGRIEVDPDSASPTGELKIRAASVNTRMPPRDLHLRTGDFLAVRKHPEILVRADRIEPAGEGAFSTSATIEILGVTQQVDLTLHAHRHGEDAASGRARIHVQGLLDRHAFGVKAMPPAEWVVAREVQLDCELLLERVG
jgi:polyisoprenoid-binding protein YceI